MNRPTLGDRLLRFTLKGAGLGCRLCRRYPSLPVSALLHLGLLACLGYFITLPAGKTPAQPFAPVLYGLQTQDQQPDELLPAVEEPGDSAVGGATDHLLPNIPAQAGALLGTTGAGIHGPVVLPSVTGGNGSSTGGGTGKPVRNRRTGKLFGLEVQTGNAGLVVFLDKSNSMKAVAERVQKLVEQDFPKAVCIELNNALFCTETNLDKLGRSKKIGEPLLGYYRSSLAKSVIPLGTNYLQTCGTPPESVYMMSDFEDYVDFSSLNEFGNLLVEKKVKFFAHSVGQRPPASIARVCQLTGGAVLVLPPEKLPKASAENE
jgi:hypothetical protein